MTYLEKKAISRHLLKAIRAGRITDIDALARSYGVEPSVVRTALGSKGFDGLGFGSGYGDVETKWREK